MPIDTKLARMVIYCARLPPLKPQDPWIMDQHEVTWKFEKYVSPFQVLTEFWQCVLTSGRNFHANAQVVTDFLFLFFFVDQSFLIDFP